MGGGDYGFCGWSTKICRSTKICTFQLYHGGGGKLFKIMHIFSFSHPYTALSEAMAYTNEIFRLHALPMAIVSGRDPVFSFTSKQRWQELFRLSDTTLNELS